MDARAEAEKRYPIPEGRWAPEWPGFIEQPAFLAGAVWALREFGDLLENAAANESSSNVPIAVAEYGWAAEAHHIADGIEES